jgi:glucose uptake protein GlcU
MFKKIAVGVVAAVLVVAGIIINTKKQKEQPTIIDKQE